MVFLLKGQFTQKMRVLLLFFDPLLVSSLYSMSLKDSINHIILIMAKTDVFPHCKLKSKSKLAYCLKINMLSAFKK